MVFLYGILGGELSKLWQYQDSDSDSEYSPSESSHECDYETSDSDEEEQNASSSTLYPDADTPKLIRHPCPEPKMN